jgi:hypothetical protein
MFSNDRNMVRNDQYDGRKKNGYDWPFFRVQSNKFEKSSCFTVSLVAIIYLVSSDIRESNHISLLSDCMLCNFASILFMLAIFCSVFMLLQVSSVILCSI